MSGVGGDLRGYNPYAYCFNNPVMYSDRTGNWPKWLTGALNALSGAMQMIACATLGVSVVIQEIAI